MTLVDSLTAERAVVAHQIGTLNVTADGASPDRYLELLHRVVNGEGDEGDRTALERALLAGGSASRLAFPRTSILIKEVGTLNQTTQLVEASALTAALAAHQSRIQIDRIKSSLQAYMSALRAWTGTLPYRLSNQPNVSLDSLYVPLLAREGGTDAVAVPIAEIIGKGIVDKPGRPVLILGDAGSGKSTYLRHIAHCAWDEPEKIGLDRPYLVMPIRLRVFSTEGASVEERLWRTLGRSGEIAVLDAPPPSGFLTAWAKAVDARWLLLLDGLDEVSRELRADIVEWALQLGQQGDLITPVLTCRAESGIDDTPLPKRALKLVLEPFSKRQKAELGRKWLGGDPESFLREIDRAGLGAETNSPLVATLAASVFGVDGRLPDNRIAIFEAYIALCLRQAERQGGLTKIGVSDIIVRHALQTLAVASIEDQSPHDTAKVESMLAAFLAIQMPTLAPLDRQGKTRDLSNALALTGLIVIGPASRWLHASLRDYLAARQLASQHGPESAAARDLAAQWSEESRQGSLIFLFALWSQSESEAKSGVAKSTSGLIESLLYDDNDAAKKKPAWSRWFSAVTSRKARHVRSIKALRFAIEVVAESHGIEPAIIDAITKELASRSDTLTVLGSCARIFTSDSDEISALTRWRHRRSLLKHLDPVLQRIEETIGNVDAAKAAGALAFLAWIGREDRFLALCRRADVPATAVFGALSRLAGEDQDGLVGSLFESTFEPALLRAIAGLNAVTILQGMHEYLNSIVSGDAKELQRRLNDSSSPPILRTLAAIALFRHTVVETKTPVTEEEKGNLKATFKEIFAQLPNDANSRIPSFVKEHENCNTLDIALDISAPSHLDAASRDSHVPVVLRDYIRLYRTAQPPVSTFEELRNQLLPEAFHVDSFSESLSNAVSTLRRIGRDDIIERYACDERLREEWSDRFIKGLTESERIRLASDPNTSLQLRNRVWRLLLDSKIADTAQLAKQSYSDSLNELLAADPTNTKLLRRRAAFFSGENRWVEAIADLNLLVENDPKDADLWYERGRARYFQNEDQAALQDLNRALEIAPRHVQALYLKGKALRYLSRLRESIETLSLSIKAGNQTIAVFEARARAFYQLGFFQEACADWSAAYGSIDKIPDLDTKVVAAGAFLAAGHHMEAMPILMAVAEQGAANAAELDDLARCLVLAGNQERALEIAKRAVAADDAGITFRLMLGLAARLSGIAPETLPDFSCIVERLEGDKLRGIKSLHYALIAGDRPGLEGLTGIDRFDGEGANEADLRWAIWELNFTASQLATDPLGEMALKAIEPARRTLAGLPPPLRPEDPDKSEKAVPRRLEKPPAQPGRLPVGMLCGLHAITGFEEEMLFAKQVLSQYGDKRTLYVFELEDRDSIYGQCNFKLRPSDRHEYKFGAPFSYVAQNLFNGKAEWIKPGLVQRLLFDDQRTMSRFLENPRLSKYKEKFLLREGGTA